MGKVLQFKREIQETTEQAGGNVGWTSSEIAAEAGYLMDCIVDGELLGEDSDLTGFLSRIIQLHAPDADVIPRR